MEIKRGDRVVVTTLAGKPVGTVVSHQPGSDRAMVEIAGRTPRWYATRNLVRSES